MSQGATNPTDDVRQYYTHRHTQRADLFPEQPFANYGYWTRPDLTIEQASEAMAALVGATAGLNPADHVLEVGCGYGACAVIYARRFQPGSLIGIDLTDVRIEEGRRYVEKQGKLTTSIDLRVGNACKLDFAAASFDKVLAVECAFHFDTRVDFLREAGRVLKPGGLLVMTDLIPRRGTDMVSPRIGDKAAATQVQLYNTVNAYDADVYTGHLRAAGFGDVRIDSILPWTLAPFIPALHRHADRTVVRENAEKIHRHADRLAQLIEAGEDYVLVVARKR